MTDLLSKFNSGEIIGLTAVVLGCIIGAIAIIGGIWLQMRRAEISAALKQDMLNRGMSADQIKAVIDAGKESSCH